MRPRTLEDGRFDPWPRALRCRPCLCGHDHHDHSKILLGDPCLDCDCPGFMPIWRENPSVLSERPRRRR